MENQIIPTPAPSTNLVLISLDDLEVVINSFKSLIIEGDQCERRAWYYRIFANERHRLGELVAEAYGRAAASMIHTLEVKRVGTPEGRGK
ncbi:MAG: hypothetical protein IJK78_11825 [Bacteroidales bacterium]|nr:hypothetical protein [Bacteroidales bacterium]